MEEQSQVIRQPVKNKVVKVPVVMQLENIECGAASLNMILGYYEKWIPLEQIRTDCGVNRDGSSAKNIFKAAENYGLEVEAYKFELDEIKSEATFPCIIHWNFNHFLVLRGFQGEWAYLTCPSQGEQRISMEEFDKGFTGVCLMFKPGPNFTTSGKKKSSIDYIKSKFRGLGLMIVFSFLLTLFTSLITMITPVFSRVFYDSVLPKTNPTWTYPFLGLLIAISCCQILLALLSRLHNLKTSGKLDVVSTSSFMWRVLRLPIRFFSHRMVGDILSRKESQAMISNEIVDRVSPMPIQFVMMIAYFIIMITYNWILALIGLVSAIFDIFIARIISKKRMNSSRVLMRDNAKASATATAGFEMIETIKSSGAEDGYFARWAGYQAGSNEGSARYNRITAYYSIAPDIVSTICSSTILAIGLYLTIQGQFTLGMITAFQGYLASFSSPLQTFIEAGKELQEMQVSIERLDDVMNYPIDEIFNSDSSDIDEYKKLSGSIEIDDITFGYSLLDEPLIKNFSASIKRGSSIAFVGASGCGKSTLSKLISGIEKPWSGSITFDGKTVSQINRSIFTSSVAVVDQDITIFEDSIKNNVKMYDNSIEDFEMILAARDAQIHDDIMQRDGGYDYVLCDGGKDFSGGQKQRLEIARVLAGDPSICILDEATSALDAKTEHEAVKAIKERNITCIVIAHRLSTIRDCDEIIVLDHGDVVERGTHDQLMKMNGYYTKLINAD